MAEQVKRETRRLAETQHNLEHLSAIHSVTAAASESLELDTILQEVIKKITEIFRFDATRIFLFNSQMDELNLRASFESKPEDRSQVSTFKRGQGNVGRVAETGEPLIFEDIQRNPQYQKSSQTKNAHRVGISFFAVFPIKVTARTVGTIVFIGQDPRRLTSDEFRLITSMANQIGVAVENANLFKKTKADARELSALYTVSSTVNSSLDLDVVLQEVIEKINGIFDFDTVRIYLFNPEVDGFDIRASFPPNRDDLSRVKLFRQGQGVVGKVGESGEPLVIEDTQTDPQYREMSQSKNTLRTGHRFLAAFPIKTKFKCVGTILCNGKAPRSLLSGEIRLLASMGEQIGIAVENANLFEASKARARELSALYSVATVINKSLELGFLLRSVMEKVLDIFDFDAARIYLYDKDNKELRLLAHRGFPENAIPSDNYKPGQGILGRVFERAEPVFFEDIQTDPRFHQMVYKGDVLRAGYRGSFGIPIKVKNKTLGVINFVSKNAHRFLPNEVQLIHSIADHIGIAVENAQLFEQTKKQALQLEKDITERKQAEEQLKQANTELARHEKALRDTLSGLRESHGQLKTAQSQLIQAEKLESVGTLAAGVAHEVKNPLAIMLQGIHYLSKHIATNGDNVTMALQDMDDAVKKADSVVRGLLDFSAPSELSLNTEEMNSVVEQSLSLVSHELTKYHVNAVRELSEDLPPISLDRNKIEQVFVNIFLNAVHAMPEGGTLTIKTYTKRLTKVIHNVSSRKADDFKIGETVVIAEVEDTGTGIPKDKLTEVFDPFFTTKVTGKGTGLGLTVTKKIIDLHGGTIDIGNRKDGGTRVTIMFKA